MSEVVGGGGVGWLGGARRKNRAELWYYHLPPSPSFINITHISSCSICMVSSATYCIHTFRRFRLNLDTFQRHRRESIVKPYLKEYSQDHSGLLRGF